MLVMRTGGQVLGVSLPRTPSAACTWGSQWQIMWDFPYTGYVQCAPCFIPGQTAAPHHHGALSHLPPPGPEGNWLKVKAVGVRPGRDFQKAV